MLLNSLKSFIIKQRKIKSPLLSRKNSKELEKNERI